MKECISASLGMMSCRTKSKLQVCLTMRLTTLKLPRIYPIITCALLVTAAFHRVSYGDDTEHLLLLKTQVCHAVESQIQMFTLR